MFRGQEQENFEDTGQFGDFGISIKIRPPKISLPTISTSSITRPISQVASAAARPISALTNVVRPILTTAAYTALKPVALLEQKTGLAKFDPLVQGAVAKMESSGLVSDTMMKPLTAIAPQIYSRPAPTPQEVSGGSIVQYQDENGNSITKEQYDALMAQYAQSGGVQYQDENGNTITKEQYDALMAGYVAQDTSSPSTSEATSAPLVNIQTVQGNAGGGGTSWESGRQGQQETIVDTSHDGMQTAPTNLSPDILDELTAKIVEVLQMMKNKAATGGSLSDREKDFIDFMHVDVLGGGDISNMAGFGFSPMWNKNNFPPMTRALDSEELFTDESEEAQAPFNEGKKAVTEEDMPTFNKQAAGAFAPSENFSGMEEWRMIR